MLMIGSACHHRRPTEENLVLAARAGSCSARMPEEPSDHRAQLRAVQAIVIVAVVLAACALLAFGAVRVIHALF